MTITHFDRNRKSENKRASLPEEPPKKTRGKVARNSSRPRAISKETRLTEPITSRKGQRIRNREDKRNNYRISQRPTNIQLQRGQRIHTNQTQPNNILQPHNCQYSQSNPQRGCRVQTQPKEALVRGIDGSRVRVGALKDPVRFARLGVYFVPPAQTD